MLQIAKHGPLRSLKKKDGIGIDMELLIATGENVFMTYRTCD